MIRNKNFMLVMRRLIVGFINIGFNHCEYDHNVYVLHVHGDTLIVASYVDDLHITQNNASLLLGLKNQLAYTFEMIDIGLVLVCFISFCTFKFCKWMMVSFFINQNILWLFGNDSRLWCQYYYNPPLSIYSLLIILSSIGRHIYCTGVWRTRIEVNYHLLHVHA